MITQCWKHGMVPLQYGTIKIMHNTFRIKPYTSDKIVEDIITEKYV